MKPFDVKSSTYINSMKEINDEDPKFKIGDIVRISRDIVRTSRHKNTFAKGYVPNWSEEDLMIKKFKNTVPSTYFISDLNAEEILETFYEKEFQETNKKTRFENVIKKKGNKLYVKWKGYDSSFTSWIDNKDIV